MEGYQGKSAQNENQVSLQNDVQQKGPQIETKFSSIANASPQSQQMQNFAAIANGSAYAQRMTQLNAIANVGGGAEGASTFQQPKNNTGLPDQLKSGIESLGGYSMDDVRVHYNSSKPAQLQAHAYAQGTEIHIAPGQEKHLPHEAWHVVQQKQGRVKPTLQMKGIAINDDSALEKEADVMGAKAMGGGERKAKSSNKSATTTSIPQLVVQRAVPNDFKPTPNATLLDPDPSKWARPAWYNGAAGGAATIRQHVWEKLRVRDLFEIRLPDDSSQLLCICPYCASAVSFMGASVEHMVSWREYAQSKGARTISELNYWYHDLDNLIVVHSACNSSAQKLEPEDVAMRGHSASSPATWGASHERFIMGSIIQNLKQQFRGSGYEAPELFGRMDNLLLEVMKGNISFGNALFSIQKLVGDEAFGIATKGLL